MNRMIGRIATGTLFSAVISATLLAAGAQRGPQHVDIVVVGRDDRPVTNVTVRDLIVREDGVAREVATVAPAGLPSPVVLLIDNSQAAAPAVADLRQALTSFVTALTLGDQPVQVGWWTFGDRPTRVATQATGAVVQREVDRLFTVPGTGAHLLATIVQVCNELVKAGAVRPALVAFVAESGPEFSHEDRPRVAEALQRAGATLWVVYLQAPSGTLPETPENRERAAVIGDTTRDSGGLSLPALSAQGIGPAFARLQALLASRLRVGYARPEALVQPTRLEITTRTGDTRVLAPRWPLRQADRE